MPPRAAAPVSDQPGHRSENQNKEECSFTWRTDVKTSGGNTHAGFSHSLLRPPAGIFSLRKQAAALLHPNCLRATQGGKSKKMRCEKWNPRHRVGKTQHKIGLCSLKTTSVVNRFVLSPTVSAAERSTVYTTIAAQRFEFASITCERKSTLTSAV